MYNFNFNLTVSLCTIVETVLILKKFEMDKIINVKQVKCIDVKKNPKLFTLFLNNGIRNVMSCLKYIEIGQTGKFFKKNNN